MMDTELVRAVVILIGLIFPFSVPNGEISFGVSRSNVLKLKIQH